MVIRDQTDKKRQKINIQTLCEELEIGYVAYNDFFGNFDKEPAKFTIVHVKGMFRMGKELSKNQ